METVPSPDTLAIPPDLLAELQAEAVREHRSAEDLLRELLGARKRMQEDDLPSGKRTATEAVAHIFEARKGRHLPDGMSIRDMMTHGRD